MHWHDTSTDEQLRRAVRAGARVRVPVRIRGLRPDAARSARRGRAAGAARHAGRARSCGAAALYVPRRRSPRITAALETALFDDAERARICCRGASGAREVQLAARGAPTRWRCIESAGRAMTRCRSSSSSSTRAAISSAASSRCTPRRRRSPHDIVVVDNASTDGSADGRARGAPDVRVDRSGSEPRLRAREQHRHPREPRRAHPAAEQRHGRAARRRSTRWSRSSIATRRWPSSDRGSSTAADAPELSFGRMIGPLNEWRQKRLARDQPRGRGADAPSGAIRTGSAARACSSAAPTPRLSAGLDERFFMYTEDVDFCAAIRARGRRILFTPDVEVVHLRGRSAAAAPAATHACLPPQPARVLREAPPDAWVAAAPPVSAAARSR